MTLGVSDSEKIIIVDILKEFFKDYSFYFYGSRVKGNFYKTSDLDILIKGNNQMPLLDLANLKEKFNDSYLPYIVNFTDYFNINPQFYNLIQNDLVLINN